MSVLLEKFTPLRPSFIERAFGGSPQIRRFLEMRNSEFVWTDSQNFEVLSVTAARSRLYNGETLFRVCCTQFKLSLFFPQQKFLNGQRHDTEISFLLHIDNSENFVRANIPHLNKKTFLDEKILQPIWSEALLNIISMEAEKYSVEQWLEAKTSQSITESLQRYYHAPFIQKASAGTVLKEILSIQIIQ